MLIDGFLAFCFSILYGFCVISLLVSILLIILYNVGFKYQVKCVLYLSCLVIGGWTGGLLSVPYGKTTDNHFRIFRVFQCMTSFLGIKFIPRHEENLISDKPFVLIANHQSALDVLGMTFVWPQNCSVMLKSSLKFLPGFNLCAYLCEAIYINRFSKEKAHKTVDDTLNDIISKKRKVWIYPEGTRNAEKTLLPFKKGAFIIAKQANIPIVCAVFSSHKFFYDYSTSRFDNSGEVLIDVLPPIDSSKFETVDELSEHCRQVMQKRHDELNIEMTERLHRKAE